MGKGDVPSRGEELVESEATAEELLEKLNDQIELLKKFAKQKSFKPDPDVLLSIRKETAKVLIDSTETLSHLLKLNLKDTRAGHLVLLQKELAKCIKYL